MNRYVQAEEKLAEVVEENGQTLKLKQTEVDEALSKITEMEKVIETTKSEAQDHWTTCEKYRIDLEATLQPNPDPL